MSILKKFLIFEANRSNYNYEEQDIIERSIRKEAESILSKASSKLIDAIDNIKNDLENDE